ncbi:leucine carboxyl methyltransferase 2 [Nannizzia gypsea CBS 118893]|uniref:tRNA wybutosine-synthesizing protein 4 n=1 Tax=Arthroderma gypseum (strain ATCC MYA-4604 / CBS 118893) TaxID=535722 RepID=E4UN17_ARTGP|nr:leucine carboxyl methyltransferase 2 [Nannizzia gypsea CBS 118893]EFR00319.1 leucine carboxyl methyltransferase 2 [Nannizzia gypsea CBS 118893]
MRKTNEIQTEKEAGMVMGTNGSSIVSKRSVERIYYKEPHFFRHFVKSSPRRAPLVNRGYWLRMYAIKHTVTEFLEEVTGRPKLVINFGCGLDPLVFQLLSQRPGLCRDTIFVDIDHRKMMLEKWEAIQSSPELKELIPDAILSSGGGPLICARQYIGIGCDLGNLSELERTLKPAVDTSEFSILCIAEVALTYMAVKAADALISWAARLSDDTQFGLLEQFFPDGPEHPFARTMIAHFTKWRAPLQSIHIYPTLVEQEQRFLNAGWEQAKARSLWEAWSDPTFISAETRLSLDKSEAFDEWEEIALFASHYFWLRASTRATAGNSNDEAIANTTTAPPDPQIRMTTNFQADLINHKRFGALFSFGGQIGFHAGLGQQARLSSTDVYLQSDTMHAPVKSVPPESLPARERPPSKALEDTWLMDGGIWRQSCPFPTASFRHSATAVILPSGEEGVLVYGGKVVQWHCDRAIFSVEKHQWHRNLDCVVEKWRILHAALRGRGVLTGGMSQDGLVLDDFWTWQISTDDTGDISIHLIDQKGRFETSHPQISKWVGRFGATAHRLEDKLVLIGGIAVGGCIPHGYEIITLDLSIFDYDDAKKLPIQMVARSSPTHARPLLVGHSSIPVGGGSVLIAGGGAVCFAFGTYWNNGTWLLNAEGSCSRNNEWRMLQP